MLDMPPEVYSTVKPVSPVRTIVVAFLLLLFTCILAMKMSNSRAIAADKFRIRPDQWDISLQMPIGFSLNDVEESHIGQFITSELLLHDNVKIDLTIWRLPIEGEINPIQPCESLMRWLQTKSSWSLNRLLQLGQPTMKPITEQLGDISAYESIDHRIATVVRVGVFSDRVAYGVSMRTHGVELEPTLYTIFDRTCQSIKLESN